MWDLAEEAASYYNELTAGVDEDSLTISPEADKVLGLALEAGLCQWLTPEDIIDVLNHKED